MRWLSSLFETAKDTTTTLIWLFGAISMLGAIGLAFEKWFSHLNTFGIVSFYIMMSGLFLIVCVLILNWIQKRNIEKIPDLIERLDVLTTNFIDDFTLELSPEDWKNINKDYSVILGLDLSRLETALSGEYNKAEVERAFNSVSKAYTKKLDPQKKAEESLVYLGDMGSILDTYNAGLGRLKATAKYQKLEKKIKSLQRQAPSAYISVKVNDYFIMSEKLYIMLLGTKPLFDQPMLTKKLPAKIGAKKSQIRPIVDGQISNLITGVRESIVKYKERNKEQSITKDEKDKAKR